jgi:hypothetical protein
VADVTPNEHDQPGQEQQNYVTRKAPAGASHNQTIDVWWQILPRPFRLAPDIASFGVPASPLLTFHYYRDRLCVRISGTHLPFSPPQPGPTCRRTEHAPGPGLRPPSFPKSPGFPLPGPLGALGHPASPRPRNRDWKHAIKRGLPPVLTSCATGGVHSRDHDLRIAVRREVRFVRLGRYEASAVALEVALNVDLDRRSRVIPIPLMCVAPLRWQRMRQAEQRAAAGADWHKSDHVFTTRSGKPIEPRNLYRSFLRIYHERLHPRERRPPQGSRGLHGSPAPTAPLSGTAVKYYRQRPRDP